jgi:hypothetical protein
MATASKDAATLRRHGWVTRIPRNSTSRQRFPADSVRSVTILPDTKDWTWVLDRPCPECDYDAGASFTVDTFSRYMLHDVEHHLWDVR